MSNFPRSREARRDFLTAEKHNMSNKSLNNCVKALLEDARMEEIYHCRASQHQVDWIDISLNSLVCTRCYRKKHKISVVAVHLRRRFGAFTARASELHIVNFPSMINFLYLQPQCVTAYDEPVDRLMMN